MSDVAIFIVGLFVTLTVCSAVGLLLWGASNEPQPGPDNYRASKGEEDDDALGKRSQVVPVS